jgi:pimeloyl-ACP methyl ester carboxylesterase
MEGLEEGVALAGDGARLSFYTRAGGAHTLLFVHGWASTKEYWHPTIASLDADRVSVVALDLRGHGDSEPRPGYDAPERLVQDVLAVADHFGLERFIAVGHSMGAKYIQLLPGLAGDRVVGLVLVAGMPPGLVPLASEEQRRWVSWAGDPEAMLACHREIIHTAVPEELALAWARRAARVPADVLDRTLDACFRTSIENHIPDAPRLPPILVVAGRHDPIFDLSLLREMSGRWPNAGFVSVEAGHEVPLEQPELLAGLVSSFAAGCFGSHTRFESTASVRHG